MLEVRGAERSTLGHMLYCLLLPPAGLSGRLWILIVVAALLAAPQGASVSWEAVKSLGIGRAQCGSLPGRLCQGPRMHEYFGM